MYCLAPYFEHGERIVHARRGTGTVTHHVGAGGTRTCVRFDSGAVPRYTSTLTLSLILTLTLILTPTLTPTLTVLLRQGIGPIDID